jgi:hypothetical protein
MPECHIVRFAFVFDSVIGVDRNRAAASVGHRNHAAAFIGVQPAALGCVGAFIPDKRVVPIILSLSKGRAIDIAAQDVANCQILQNIWAGVIIRYRWQKCMFYRS